MSKTLLQFYSYTLNNTCNHRQMESRQPKVPMTICNKTFDLVVQRLKALDYTGPTCLSCDDTKLLSGLRLYWDGEEMAHYLVGAVGGPIFVPDIDNLQSFMTDTSIVEGKKVRTSAIRKKCKTDLMFTGSRHSSTNSSTKGRSHHSYSNCYPREPQRGSPIRVSKADHYGPPSSRSPGRVICS